MTTEVKSKIAAIAGDVSILAAVFSSFPYAFGDVADAMGPEAKKWVAIIALAGAGISKIAQRILELLK